MMIYRLQGSTISLAVDWGTIRQGFIVVVEIKVVLAMVLGCRINC